VAERALSFARLAPYARPALVNGAVGAVVVPDDRPFAVLAFTVTNGKIVEIDVLSDPVRLGALDLSGFG
jgi:RNA polymerase sigma-70 factor (ECF subfamily)